MIIDRLTAVIDEDMQEYTTEKEQLEESEGKASEEEREVMAGLHECSKQQELFSTKNMAIQKKRDELTKRFQVGWFGILSKMVNL